MNDEAEITETMVDHVRIVQITGEFDADEADTVTAALRASRTGAARATVVDLSQLSFADSSLLHALLTAQRHHERAGLAFVLAGAPPLVRRLLDLTDTARVFTTAPQLTAALDLVRADARPHRS